MKVSLREGERTQIQKKAGGKRRQRLEGRGHRPRDAWGHRAVKEAGRTLPGGLHRECSLAFLIPRTMGE